MAENFIEFDKRKLEELCAGAKSGNENMRNALFGMVHDIAYSYFLSKFKLKKLKSIEDVEDLSQNTCLTYINNLEKIENPEFWLRRVVFLIFVNHYKKAQKGAALSLDEKIIVRKKAPQDEFEAFDKEKAVELINKLKGEKKQIVLMRIWEDLKFQEIADKLNKNEPAVKKMFYRCMEEMKNLLEMSR